MPSSIKTHVVKFVVAGIMLAAPLPALAQSLVIGQSGGVTVGNQRGVAAQTSVGVTVSPYFRITGEYGHLSSILPQSVSDDINSQASTYASQFGNTATTSGSLHADTFSAMVRAHTDSSQTVGAFVEAGGGFAHLSGSYFATMVDPVNGNSDITSQVAEPVLTSSTQGLFTVGGGLTFAINRRTGLDVGYRFNRIGGDTPINSGSFYTGLQLRF